MPSDAVAEPVSSSAAQQASLKQMLAASLFSHSGSLRARWMPERKEKASCSPYTDPSASLMLIFFTMPMGYSAAALRGSRGIPSPSIA